MQINLTAAVAWDFSSPSKPQPLQTKSIRTQDNKRAMHPLFAPKRLRVHRLTQWLVQKPAAEYLAPEIWRHPRRFSDKSPVSMWLILATCMAVAINTGAALLHLVSVPVQ